jgi:ABC-type amino acid transport substrate-binding protein
MNNFMNMNNHMNKAPRNRRSPGSPAVSRVFGMALLCMAACAPLHCGAQDGTIGKLDTEVVVGGQRPAAGFNPMHDRYWLGGYKESFTSEIPEELRNVDALTRARKLRRLVACADAWYYPFSERIENGVKSGIDLDIAQAIASRQGWRVEVVWANTGSFGGIGREFRRGIARGYCDFFTGLVITGDDYQVEKNKLTFTRPYLGLGFVLVAQGKATHVRTLDEIKQQGIKLGVLMFSPMEEYIRRNAIDHELYYQNQRLIDGMVQGEVQAAMLWSGALATLKRDYQAEFSMVPGYVPPKGQRWNGAWAIPKKEPELKRFLDEQFEALLKDGEIKRIVESYGMPFYPPFDD